MSTLAIFGGVNIDFFSDSCFYAADDPGLYGSVWNVILNLGLSVRVFTYSSGIRGRLWSQTAQAPIPRSELPLSHHGLEQPILSCLICKMGITVPTSYHYYEN